MAKLDFNLTVQHFTDDPGLSSENGKCVLNIIGATVVGSPYFRFYPEDTEPGAWQLMSPNGQSGFKNTFFLSPGPYQLDYKDDAGERKLMKFSVFSQEQLSCLQLNQGFLWAVINLTPVTREDFSLQVVGYGSGSLSLGSPSGEVAVNDSPFKVWEAGARGAVWTDAELQGLGVDTSIDRIRFRIPGQCEITIAEEVHFGEPGIPTEVEASYMKQDCSAPGANDGSITVTVSGGSGNYSFQWDDGPVTQNRTNLAPGTYSVTITDNVSGAVVIFSNIEITAPPVVSEDVTEEITVEVRRPSCDASKAVYLCWLNSLGGWDHWLFEDRNDDFETDINTRTNEEFSRYIERLDDVQSAVDYLSRTVRRSLRLGTGKIGPDQVEGFVTLFSSPRVLMLTSAPDVRPPEWIGVRVKDGSFRFNAQTQEAEVTIELPDLNIQTN